MIAVDIPGKFGFGTMSLTWTTEPKPLKEQIQALKFVTTHDDFGTNLLNGGEFYGEGGANLKLFKRFLATNTPEQNRNLVISIKGGLGPNLQADGSETNIKKSIDNILKYFSTDPKNRPKLIYEIARVDPKIPYEDTISFINEYVKSGKLDGISLSEVGVESIKKAVSVATISCVELELSLLAQDILNNGILHEASKNDITIIAYSPLSRGLLTDFLVENSSTFLDSIPEDDFRKHLDKFQPDIFNHNLKLIKELYKFAHDVKGVSLESLSLSWIVSLSNRNYKGIKLSKIIPIPSGSTPDKIKKNLSNIIELSDDDLNKIDNIVKSNPVKGLRYNEYMEETLNL